MKTGKVKFFNESKGFGFIIDEETDKEFFFHFTGCVDKVKKDDNVEFELTDSTKGPKCTNITKLNP